MSLIELITVVAIVAILGSIALSTYRNSVIRSNRAEAAAALLRIQVAQEKYFLSANEYAETLDELNMEDSTERDLYTLELADIDDPTRFTARATAINGQADDTACPVLSIDETGRRTPSPVDTPCWR
ncbi:hypothetical protein GCM10011487_28340 [Steroidobacter agaridevorans]|uniref:Pilus assembly protein PilE n=2 Tax=Steroidobacter agaridevorans TaxID=2695856 RepID=A0A829YBR9_9GAMM|nr:hypothetical protein GCM10011487_28340 [Steroidobacter agaridevorans]GFE87935.1 hypothetical protein GCM10011488_28890 [Steroidobacter agaridevorans]